MLRSVLKRGPRIKRCLVSSKLSRDFTASSCFNTNLPPKESTLPKFTFPKHTTTIAEINQDVDGHLGETITISGWIDKKPKQIGKNIIFGRFRDFEGNIIQIISKTLDIVSLLSKAQVEDCVAVTGIIDKKQVKGAKENITQWELTLTDYKLLNQSDVLNSQLESLKYITNEFPPQYRYLQLRLPYYQNALKKRAQAAQLVRNLLSSRNFIEVETPVLFKSTPEGAREFLVPTRKQDSFYALPQSPQQYKQLLMASGVKNYFQIARCFRDEDLRADRQPEFTQIDLEMSFANAQDVQEVIESLVQKVWEEVAGERIKTIDGESGSKKTNKFVHLTYKEALTKYGIDKPDLRSTLSFIDLSEFTKVKEDNEFSVFEVCVLKDAFSSNRQIKPKLFDVSLYKNRKPIIVPIKTEQERSEWLEKFKSLIDIKDESKIHELIKLEIGDVIAGSTRAELPYENPTPLGAFRQLSIAEYPNKWIRPNAKFVGAWIENFPLFTPSEVENTTNVKQDFPVYDYDKLQSTHHPFTMAKPEDYEKLETAPLEVKGEHYDLVINGVELGGGSRRVHDSDLQRFIFTEILKIKDPDYLFGHLLKALTLGCPPHAGIALGFDRMCAMLIGSSSIRDVVAFPKTASGNDPVVGSPSQVSDEVLTQYHVKKLEE